MRQLKKAVSCCELSGHIDLQEPRYEVGNYLTLKLRLAASQSPTPFVTKAQILKCFLPFTQSQVMLVRLSEPARDLDGEYVVKLYNRRYMSSSRQHKKSPEWSPTLEKDYRLYTVQRSYLKWTSSTNSSPKTSPGTSPTSSFTSSMTNSTSSTASEHMQNEEEYQEQCADMYQTELEVYNRLQDIQGEDVPRLIAQVEVPEYYPFKIDITSHSGSNADLYKHSTPGILLQHIANAFTLADLYNPDVPPRPPREAFQYLGDEAISIIDKIRSRGILNTDVAPRNSLVCWSGFCRRWKVFLMDFGHCFLREDESDKEWRGQQFEEDEEGAMGLALSQGIKKHRGGGYYYYDSPYKQAIQKEFG